MPQTESHKSLIRESYRAYQAEDREAMERLFAAPNDGRLASFDLVRLVESGDEVVATYEATRADGTRFRNTEIHRFAGEEIAEVEVYFGWDLE
ncbi:MAG: hypothetical protein H0X42_02300 [Solirubrobacterales bacterium]|nr:hypothetical protein [Solirubrobacterales bacterium]